MMKEQTGRGNRGSRVEMRTKHAFEEVGVFPAGEGYPTCQFPEVEGSQ